MADIPPQYQEAFQQATRQYPSVPPGILYGLITQESSWNPLAGNTVGAGHVGLGQFDPATAARMGLTDRTNGAQSILAAARYLSQLVTEHGSLQNGLAAYNGGPGAVAALQRGQPWQETQTYLRAVNAYAAQYGDGSSVGSSTGAPVAGSGSGTSSGGNPVLGCLPGAAGGAAALLGAFWWWAGRAC